MGELLMKTFNRRGFTVVEVLIAVFIFSVGVLAVISMLTTALRANSLGRGTTVANRLVQQQMEEVKSVSFTTMVNYMCGYGVTRADGFTGACTMTKTSKTLGALTNRTTTEYKTKYMVSSSGLSNVTYDVTMQSVKNYPRSNIDMIAGKAEWRDWAGPHNVTAMTYIER